jgi:phosphopantothenoylcysteine decarboxylase/phosphopantothenate--cysteine ligase
MKRVLVCVGGGIAAYKACEVVRLLVKQGAQVRCALTAPAQRFVSALTFQALSGGPVATDLWDSSQELAAGHIALADWAELAVVAPATADLLARLRAGLADDVVTATLIAIEPARWLLAPAMNEKMWASPAVQENVQALRSRGARVLGPAVGEMAERSHVGPGRMVEAAEIAAAVAAWTAPGAEPLDGAVARTAEAPGAAAARLPTARDLEGVAVLVTAGPTREALDPVRFLSNPSTGRMGFAIAEAARDRGALVTLIAGPTELAPPAGVQLLRIVSAEELARAVDQHLGAARVLVMTAAVADQRPLVRAPQKVKKQDGEEILTLVRTPDILAAVGAREVRPLLVGFAAETENLEANAREKLLRKRLDFIVANDVSAAGAGFAAETNRVLLLSAAGARVELSGSKREVADGLWTQLAPSLALKPHPPGVE